MGDDNINNWNKCFYELKEKPAIYGVMDSNNV